MKKLFRLFSLASLLSVSLSSCSSLTQDFTDNTTPNNPSENTVEENVPSDDKVEENVPSDDKVDEDTPKGDKEEDKDTNPSQDSESEGKEEGENPKDDDKEPEPIVIEKFTVTWINGDGKVLETVKDVYKGSKPSCSKTPKKTSSDEHIKYEFIGWSEDPDATAGIQIKDLPTVTKDMTYYSIFKTVEYCIATFVVSPLYNSNFKRHFMLKKEKLLSSQLMMSQ